jgi:cell division protein FtsQ
MAGRPAADKRFKRGRVRPARERRAWGRMAWRALRLALGAALAVWGSERGVALATSAPFLRVRSVVIDGTHQLEEEAVRRLAGVRGRNIVQLDLDATRARLLREPWIKDAVLRKALPSRIEITIAEREPLGIARVNERLYLVSTDGILLNEYGPRFASFDLPIIDGLHAGPSRDGLLVDQRRATLAADVLDNLRRAGELAGRVSQVDVSQDDDAVVMLADDPARVHLGTEQFAERLQAYVDLAPTLRARVVSIDYVDVRFDSRVFVKPTKR